MIKRNQTWDYDLMCFMLSVRNAPFVWGIHDCVLFAVDCAIAMTGIDLAQSYRGYETESAAKAIIQKAGGFKNLISSNVGNDGMPVKLAKRGDWCMVLQDGREALSVCLGNRLIAAGSRGLVSLNRDIAKAAWRIG